MPTKRASVTLTNNDVDDALRLRSILEREEGKAFSLADVVREGFKALDRERQQVSLQPE